ncbi:MAG TPA: GNAT family N-acetyltransferase [Solirubrobacterales bacterium]|nr:GNAT family N-acetyltransferase [Solirubrobacterales bacterium]
MASVSIRPVRTRRELKRFVKVPFGLHRDHPQWVPPLIFERMQFLDPKKNPWFEHGEAEFFVAERDGEPVGRISAHLDHRWDEYRGGRDAMFGFFESAEGPEVAQALLDAAGEWAAARGRERILGPMDFTTNDEVGILIEGFERQPMVLEPWHPPHYKDSIEAAGFVKAMDVLMWELRMGELKEGERFDPSIHAAAEKALSDEGIVIRNMRKRDMANEVRRFMDVYNEAWGDNWGFVPITDAEVEFQAKNLKQVLDEEWTFMAEKDGEVVGAALTLPDINQVLARMNGRLLPGGWLKFLLGRRKIDRLRVFALGVKHDYRHTGVAAGLYLEHIKMAAKPDEIHWGEMGWILETNGPMNRAMEGMGGKVVKRYRLYERALQPAAA